MSISIVWALEVPLWLGVHKTVIADGSREAFLWKASLGRNNQTTGKLSQDDIR